MKVMLALIASLVLALVVPAGAQDVQVLKSGVENLFGAERTKQLTSDLQDVGGRLERQTQAAAASRLIRFYVFMARVAKTDQERKDARVPEAAVPGRHHCVYAFGL